MTRDDLSTLRSIALGQPGEPTDAIRDSELVRRTSAGWQVTPRGCAWLAAHFSPRDYPNVAPHRPRRVRGELRGNRYADAKYKD